MAVQEPSPLQPAFQEGPLSASGINHDSIETSIQDPQEVSVQSLASITDVSPASTVGTASPTIPAGAQDILEVADSETQRGGDAQDRSGQESQSEPQYSPINHPPVNGQVCRYTQSNFPSHIPTNSALHADLQCSNCGTNHTPLWRRSPTGATICNACGLYLKARNQSRPVNLKKPASTPNSAPASEMGTSERQRSVSPAGDVPPHSGRPTYVPASRAPSGTCPGGGKCNGTGGADGCGGCPAYNNMVSKTTQLATPKMTSLQVATNEHAGVEDTAMETSPDNPSPTSMGADIPSAASSTTSLVLSCQNCGTTITPLWRRDEGGRTICNACGKS